MRMLNLISEGITKGAQILMSLTLGILAFSLALSVFMRNLFGFSFDFIVDLDRILFVWTCFVGLVYINGTKKLIRFDLIEQKLPPAVVKRLRFVQNLLALLLFVVMAKAGSEIFSFAKSQKFPTLPFSLVWLYVPVCLAGFLLTIQTVVSLLSPKAAE